MIRSEAEYHEAATRLEPKRQRLDDYQVRLKATGLSDDEVKRVTDPVMSFYLQLSEEVESYARLNP